MGIFYGRLLGYVLGNALTVVILLMIFQSSVHAIESNEVPATQTNSTVSALQLTPDEQKWLEGHKTIRIAYDGSLPPYSFIDDDGKIDGIAVEIMAEIGHRLGINFSVYPDSNWTSIYKAAAKRKVDMVATMVKRPERAEWFSFTKPYLTKSLVIVTRSDNSTIRSRDDLKGKKIAVVKGYQYAEQVGNEFPTATRVAVETMLESLKQAGAGQVDAAILFLGTANYLQSKYQLDNLKVAAFYDRNSANESIAVRKDWPVLVGVLQKALDSMPEQEVQKIFSKWIVGIPLPASPEEEQKPLPPAVETASELALPKPSVEEIEQKPATFDVPKKSIQPEPEPKENKTAITKMLIIAGLVAAFFILWRVLVRKQKMQKLKGEHVNKASFRHLQSSQDGSQHLSEPNPVDIQIDDLRPELGKDAPRLENDCIYYQHDCDCRFNYVSDSVHRLLGYSENDFMLNYRAYLTANPINRRIDAYTENCLQGQPNVPYEIEIYDSRRNKRWLEVMDTPVYDGQGNCIGVDGVMHDITLRKLSEAPIMSVEDAEPRVAETDVQHPLHSYVRDAVQTANQNHKSFVLIYLSMDHLRTLDGVSLNFPEEEVLAEAYKRLNATLRATDLVVKLANNQFAILLPEAEMDAVGLIIEKIRKILQIPYLVGIQSVVLDANMGSAAYPGNYDDPESLIQEAKRVTVSAELQRSKGTVIHPNDLPIDENLQLQQDLVQALDECKVTLRASSPLNINALSRHSQFLVYYQSRHNANDYTIAGFEALIRWRHPELGLLLPKDFVGLIKEIGMLDVLTYWVIQQVSFQALAWEKLGIRPNLMAINLEELAVKQAVDVNKIVAIIKETGAKPEWLELSIPEREIAKNPERIIPIVQCLVEEGITVAIDNFGPESMLHEQLDAIPAQVVEIDPEFIGSMPMRPEDIDTIARTVNLLHSLRKTVIAKQVETEEQLAILEKGGCDLIQGHLLSRPLPANEAKSLMQSLPDMVWYLQKK